MQTIELGVNLLLAYLALGFVFAAIFVTLGVAQIDPAARGTSPAFRLLILPGVAAFWPLMLVRWIASRNAEPPATPPPAPSPAFEEETDWTEVETTP